MMANPLWRAIQAARWYESELHKRQRQWLGPRGILIRAKRRWIAEVRMALREGDRDRAIDAHSMVVAELRQQMSKLAVALRTLGQAAAQRQLDAYGFTGFGAGKGLREAQDSEKQALDAMFSRLDMLGLQLEAIVAQARDDDEAAERLENWRGLGWLGVDLAVFLPGIAAAWLLGWLGDGIRGAQLGSEWGKQAVATIDANTTQTCLLVHGQVQPWDTPFVLEGEPRFAKRMQGPPFHWHCRTAVVLYNHNFDNGLTARMQEEASRELESREQGGTAHPRPSSALGH